MNNHFSIRKVSSTSRTRVYRFTNGKATWGTVKARDVHEARCILRERYRHQNPVFYVR